MDGQLLVELCFLELDAEPRAQLSIAPLPPALAEHFHLTAVRRGEPFEDLDRRGLAGAVRPEQAEALTAPDLEIEAGNGDDIRVALLQAAASQRRLRHDDRW